MLRVKANMVARAAQIMSQKEQDVWNAARNMIDRYGDNALHEVNLRIAGLKNQGDEKTQALWVEIRRVVEALQADPGSKTRH